jgi:hypothetical protein
MLENQSLVAFRDWRRAAQCQDIDHGAILRLQQMQMPVMYVQQLRQESHHPQQEIMGFQGGRALKSKP